MSLTAPHQSLNFPVSNHILAALPQEEYRRLLLELVPARLPRGRVLWEAGEPIRHGYFLLSGMTSLLSTTEDGASIEVAMVGREGFAGLPAVLKFEAAPYKVVAQLPTTALKIPIGRLNQEFARGGRMQELLLRFTCALLAQIAQSASCARFHTTEQRLSRWLLIARDRADSDELPLTHEFLAQMIGCPRTSVSGVTGRLEKLGVISQHRGRVRVRDLAGLRKSSCECYRTITEGIERFLAA
jgi:CRP-like cAMP-binding protein